jgi:hypothetical protein
VLLKKFAWDRTSLRLQKLIEAEICLCRFAAAARPRLATAAVTVCSVDEERWAGPLEGLLRKP